MTKTAARINPGAVVLVTGANGYIGSTTVNALLSLGYNVRGTVRTSKPWLDTLFTQSFGPGRYSSYIIPDLSVQNDVEEALHGCAGLVHVVGQV